MDRYDKRNVHEPDTGDDDSDDSLYSPGLSRTTPRPGPIAGNRTKAAATPATTSSQKPDENGRQSSGNGYQNSSQLTATVESESGDASEGAKVDSRRAEVFGEKVRQTPSGRGDEASSQTVESPSRRPRKTKPVDRNKYDTGSEADTIRTSSHTEDSGDARREGPQKSGKDPALPPSLGDQKPDVKQADVNQGGQTGKAAETTRRTKRDQSSQGTDPAIDDASDSQSVQGRSRRTRRNVESSFNPDGRQARRSSSPVPEDSPGGNAGMRDSGRPQRPRSPEGMAENADNKNRKERGYSGDESELRPSRPDRIRGDKSSNPPPAYSPTEDSIRRKEVPQREIPPEREPTTGETLQNRPPPRTKQRSDIDRDLKREQQEEVDLADVPITDANTSRPEAIQTPEKSGKKKDASPPTTKDPRERQREPRGTDGDDGSGVDSASEGGDMKTYYAEDARDKVADTQDTPVSPKTDFRPDPRSKFRTDLRGPPVANFLASRVPEQSEKDKSEKPRHLSKKERKQAKKEAKEAREKERAANHDSERAAAPPEPPKGFWRSLKDAFRNARQHKTKSFVCFLLGIGYVIATGYGNEYGKTTPAVKSSTSSLSARQFASTASTGLEASVSGAVKSAKQQLGSVDVSPTVLQQNFLAISILWHLIIQFIIVLLISDIISPPAPKPAPSPDGKEPAPKKSRWHRSKDSYSAGYHSIRDPISNAWHMARRATKWTYIRLGLIAFLGLTMVLVARQLSSLAHIAANPTAGPWSEWPDVTVLHHSLQANVSQLGDGGKILAASFGFWCMTMTAFAYCLSSLADRPAAPPVDEEMAVVEKEGEKEKVAEKVT